MKPDGVDVCVDNADSYPSQNHFDYLSLLNNMMYQPIASSPSSNAATIFFFFFLFFFFYLYYLQE